MVGPLGIALLAMLAMFGLIVTVLGVRGLVPRFSGTERLGQVEHVALRMILGSAGFVIVLAVTRWPVAAVFCGLGGALMPTLTAAKKRRSEALEKVEAIATWTESLRDTMAASAGIQEALRASGRVAPAPIRTEVRDLTLRLQHQSVGQSLRRFAADMNHPLSDMVVASLVLATGRRAGSLQPVLAMIAKAARDSAAMTRQIEASRTRTYSQSRMAGWLSFLMITFLVVARRSFLEPFDSFGGQVALSVICTVFLISGISLYRLGRPLVPRRPFKGIENWSNSAAAPLRVGQS